MVKRHKYDIISILSIVALAISFYLAILHYYGFSVPCSITHGCETVLSSKYATEFGLPLAVWGVGYFFLLFLLSLLANRYLWAAKTLTVFLGLGSLSALVFLSLQFFVIKKICEYCFTTDSLTIIMLLFDINLEHQRV